MTAGKIVLFLSMSSIEWHAFANTNCHPTFFGINLMSTPQLQNLWILFEQHQNLPMSWEHVDASLNIKNLHPSFSNSILGKKKGVGAFLLSLAGRFLATKEGVRLSLNISISLAWICVCWSLMAPHALPNQWLAWMAQSMANKVSITKLHVNFKRNRRND